MKIRTAIVLAGLAATGSAFAQFADNAGQRDINQQQRIEQGLKSGDLSTSEAARLQRDEARVDRMEADAMKDGKLNPAERARLSAAQNQPSREIQAARTNNIRGNPNSVSSQAMQSNTQRNINQDSRIQHGLQDGSLTRQEAAHLERQQAHADRAQYRAGADGNISAADQAKLTRRENRDGARIYAQRHDQQTKQTQRDQR